MQQLLCIMLKIMELCKITYIYIYIYIAIKNIKHYVISKISDYNITFYTFNENVHIFR